MLQTFWLIFQPETKTLIFRYSPLKNLQVNSKLEKLTMLKKLQLKKDDLFDLFAQFVVEFPQKRQVAFIIKIWMIIKPFFSVTN